MTGGIVDLREPGAKLDEGQFYFMGGGLLAAVICAPESATDAEIERYCEKENPAGTTNGWRVSDERIDPCPEAGRKHVKVTV